MGGKLNCSVYSSYIRKIIEDEEVYLSYEKNSIEFGDQKVEVFNYLFQSGSGYYSEFVVDLMVDFYRKEAIKSGEIDFDRENKEEGIDYDSIVRQRDTAIMFSTLVNQQG